MQFYQASVQIFEQINAVFSEETMHKHNFGQNLKIQSAVVTLYISSRSSKSN